MDKVSIGDFTVPRRLMMVNFPNETAGPYKLAELLAYWAAPAPMPKSYTGVCSNELCEQHNVTSPNFQEQVCYLLIYIC